MSKRKIRTTKQIRHARELALNLSFLTQLPYMLAATELHSTGGRAPMLDDICSICMFECFDPLVATPTIAYLATDRRIFREVHWCSWHQKEVKPWRGGINTYDPFVTNGLDLSGAIF